MARIGCTSTCHVRALFQQPTATLAQTPPQAVTCRARGSARAALRRDRRALARPFGSALSGRRPTSMLEHLHIRAAPLSACQPLTVLHCVLSRTVSSILHRTSDPAGCGAARAAFADAVRNGKPVDSTGNVRSRPTHFRCAVSQEATLPALWNTTVAGT
jgi:hypothetical protein